MQELSPSIMAALGTELRSAVRWQAPLPAALSCQPTSFLCMCVVLGIDHRGLHMPDKCSNWAKFLDPYFSLIPAISIRMQYHVLSLGSTLTLWLELLNTFPQGEVAILLTSENYLLRSHSSELGYSSLRAFVCCGFRSFKRLQHFLIFCNLL